MSIAPSPPQKSPKSFGFNNSAAPSKLSKLPFAGPMAHYHLCTHLFIHSFIHSPSLEGIAGRTHSDIFPLGIYHQFQNMGKLGTVQSAQNPPPPSQNFGSISNTAPFAELFKPLLTTNNQNSEQQQQQLMMAQMMAQMFGGGAAQQQQDAVQAAATATLMATAQMAMAAASGGFGEFAQFG